MITGKKILITGGAGFIGSNLCDYFIERNNHITCLDNFATGPSIIPIAIGTATGAKHHLVKCTNGNIGDAGVYGEPRRTTYPALRAMRVARVWNWSALNFLLLFVSRQKVSIII